MTRTRLPAMRADLAERSGLSIAAGGTVTGLGASVLAVGIAQAGKVDPLQNRWVLAGLAIVIVGTGWVLWSLSLALQASRKNRAVYECLGEALAQGEGLRRPRLNGHTPHPDSVEDWATR